MDIFENIRLTFRQGSSLIKLIYINATVFILVKLLLIIFSLFNYSGSFLLTYLAIPSDLTMLLQRFWTPVTYMFLHEGVWHFFFNMLTFFWFGKIFLMYFSEKQLVGLYLIGGLAGALFYVAAYNLFPYFAPELHNSILMGASGSIMAIIVATAFRSPNMELQVLFLGGIKLKYIAVFVVLTSLFGVTSNNGGGEIAHLGGALAGYLFFLSLQQGKDMTSGLNHLLDRVSDLFHRPKMRVKSNPYAKTKPMTDAKYNMNKARNIADIDRILDKIKSSGYESLSSDEKKRLFEQGNKK
jgi:membrane associated rhomboid family serine protease